MRDDQSTPVRTESLSVPVGSETVVGTVWLPTQEPSGVVVVHPATATPERFYTAFAEYVVGRGWERFLHNQAIRPLRTRLHYERGVMIASVPWHLESVRELQLTENSR